MEGVTRGSEVGRYLVLGKLGQGGLGVVLSAYDPQLDRRVAIKVLAARGAATTDEQRARMVREARALARVLHPNIVTVYDAGFHDDGLFIVMELVEGVTLRAWLHERTRPVAEVLGVFVQAGRGLAAAHAAGLVHRDFKPQNVLVGKDGRVRVADFGLARVLDAAEPAREEAAAALEGSLEESALTATGAVVGTPAYMAPEQFAGLVVDARSDQFAFCVALHEALTGVRPFRGGSYEDLARTVLAGKLHDQRGPRPMPAWLRGVVARGLARDPAARFPSMDALLAPLATDRRRRRRVIAVAAAMAATLGLTVAMGARRRGDEQLCTSAPRDLAAVWGPAARARLEGAFAESKLALAGDTLGRVTHGLDGYAAAWVAMRTEACEATHYRGTQSAAALDLRMRCLDRRLASMGALIDVFAGGLDASAIEHAVTAVAGLPALAACADTAALAQAAPPPSDPARAAAVEALRLRLLSAEASRQAGKYREAEAQAAAVVAEARATGYLPLVAEGLRDLGEVQILNAAYAAAEVSAREGLRLAAALSDDQLMAALAIGFVYVAGGPRARGDEVLTMRPFVEATLARAGDPPALQAGWLTVQAAIARRAGHYPDMLGLLEAAWRLRARELGSDSPIAASALRNVSIALMDVGRWDDARQTLLRALAIQEAALGPDHPEVAATLGSLATALGKLRRPADAVAAIERAVAINRKVLGADHIGVANVLGQQGILLLDAGDYAGARRAFERSLAIRERAVGTDHADVAPMLNRLGVVSRNLGDLDAAQRYLERGLAISEKTIGGDRARTANYVGNLALVAAQRGDLGRARELHEREIAILERSSGPDSPDYADSLLNSADTLRRLGQIAEARRRLERALAIDERVRGPVHADVAFPLVGLAAVAMDQRRYAEAQAYAARALAIRQADQASAELLADCRASEAMAAWELGRDRAANLAAVRAAREVLAATPGEYSQLLDIDAWLARRGR